MANDPFDIMATNWSGTLLICYYARLLQGDDAAKCINHLVNILCQSNLTIPHKSKIYELDGNTGFTSGIAEMLLQSYRNEIHILPAISPGWKHGSVSGMVAEGGHRVSVKWKDSMPYDISVVASQREQIKLHFNESTIVNFYEKNQTRVFTCQQGQLVEL
jgi:alpha-L-fucosidase 2